MIKAETDKERYMKKETSETMAYYGGKVTWMWSVCKGSILMELFNVVREIFLLLLGFVTLLFFIF